MAVQASPFFTGTFPRPGEMSSSLSGLGGLGTPPPLPGPVAATVVEFDAFVATDMTHLLLWRLPEGFMGQLSADTIVTDFRNGDTVRMFGEFEYSRPIDVPVDGTLGRLQETDGNSVAYEVRNLGAPIIDVLEKAGYDNNGLAELLFGNDDKFTGSNSNDILMGFGGADTMDGRGGDDLLSGGDGADSVHGGDGADLLLGDDGDDKLYGDGGNDDIRGGDGNDELLGGDGNDLLMGNLFNDSLTGGAGADTLYGGKGWDVLVGGDGDDLLFGDKGFDALYGGAGADTFYFAPGSGIDRVHDFNAAEGDRVQLQLGTSYTVEQFGADVLVVSNLVDQIVLVNVQLSSLPSGWIFGA